ASYPAAHPFLSRMTRRIPGRKSGSPMSSVAVQGPIHVLIQGLTSGRAVANPDGDYLGRPFVDLVSSSLAPGQSENVTSHFNSDSTGSIPSFRVQLAYGDFRKSCRRRTKQ